MNCLKCGREMTTGDVFCQECLDNMASAPVKPGTPVTIPTRQVKERKPVPKAQPKPEAIIARLHKTIHNLRVAVAVLSILFVLITGALSFFLYQSYTTPDIGSNYSTVSPTT